MPWAINLNQSICGSSRTPEEVTPKTPTNALNPHERGGEQSGNDDKEILDDFP